MVWSLISLALNPKAEWSNPENSVRSLIHLIFKVLLQHQLPLDLLSGVPCASDYKIHTWPCFSCQLITGSAHSKLQHYRDAHKTMLFCIGFCRGGRQLRVWGQLCTPGGMVMEQSG